MADIPIPGSESSSDTGKQSNKSELEKNDSKKPGEDKKKGSDGGGWLPEQSFAEAMGDIMNAIKDDEQEERKEKKKRKQDDTPEATPEASTETMPEGMEMSPMTEAPDAMANVSSAMELGADGVSEIGSYATEAATEAVEVAAEATAEAVATTVEAAAVVAAAPFGA
tara:strand:+ start:26161 stop:26661 length:501 start_codon:yes stop_codon:yes gene_type:complete